MSSVNCSTAARHVTELPESLLQSICNFLPPSSHLLFAVAVSDKAISSTTLPSPEWQPTPACKAIVSTKGRSTIDFGDNCEILVGRLTDDDLAGVLWCMEASSNLKQLRLTHCKNVVGHGLAPLRGSTVIEQIDLSIVEASCEDSGELGEISLDEVLPILYSIINHEGSSLKQIQFSKLWRQEQNDFLTDFIARFNQFLNARNICSSHVNHCKTAQNNAFVWVPTRGSKYGLQSLMCYECNEHICVDPEESNDYKKMCVKCEKTFCSECVQTLACQECKETSCFSCTHVAACQECRRITCINCMPVLECPCCKRIRCDDCGPLMYCSSCNSSFTNCVGCPCDKLLVEVCDFCEENFCIDCRLCTFCDDCGEMYCEECKYTLHSDVCSSKRSRTEI